jgi:hypothetical protein
LRECYADVWVECGAAGSDKGNDGVDNHDLRALVVSGGAGVEGNVNVGGNVGITENVFVGGKMDNGNVDICGNVFCSSEPRFPSELTNKKYVDSLITGDLTVITGNVSITEVTDSTSHTTGALVVYGGRAWRVFM